MSLHPQSAHENLLLRRLLPEDFALMAPNLEPISEKLGAILCRPGTPAGHAIFPENGILSMVAQSPEGQRVEAGLLGREGFGPTSLALGDDQSPYEGTVQMAFSGHRIATEPFQSALNASLTLRTTMLRFAQAFSVQASYTALSNAVHPVEERLARWILLCDDRIASGVLTTTHEFMSIMLGVRRPSVTTALHVLEGNGLIRAERGLVMVRNRAALEEFAGDAYGKAEAEYERLLGPMR